jgi:hypothetical protein
MKSYLECAIGPLDRMHSCLANPALVRCMLKGALAIPNTQVWCLHNVAGGDPRLDYVQGDESSGQAGGGGQLRLAV